MPLLSTFGAASARSFGGIGAAAAGAGLDIDEAFSTYLIDGNGSTQTINNGIDLSGEGGLVWIKNRDDSGSNHLLYDTARPLISSKISRLYSNLTNAASEGNNELSSFNSNGFTLGGSYNTNSSSYDYASWTFRKTPKFFDIVTYTGNGTPNRTISHNLGSDVGMMLIKKTSGDANWIVYHRGIGATNYLELDNDSQANDYHFFQDTAPTSTQFTIHSNSKVNENGATYVAYLFAHNDGDGGFGPDADQDVIKCGSFTTNGSGVASVNLGFETQWLMYKKSSGDGSWVMYDNMRGMAATGSNIGAILYANGNFATLSTSAGDAKATATGIDFSTGENNTTYVYMAIRRGPLAEPENATDVFAPIAYTTTDGSWQDRILQSNFTTDLAINGYRNITDGGTHTFVDRLRGYANILRSHQTNAESVRSGDYYPWPQTGQSVTSNEWSKYNAGNGLDYYNYQWKRAPGYFDAVAYSGTGSGNLQISHNLNAVPEMMWVKIRSGATNDWVVYHKDLPTSGDSKKTLFLNLNSAGGYGNYFADASGVHVAPTSSVFTLGSEAAVNGSSSYNYIAYLFATVAGVSKVGSYTGNGSTQNIDCGFSNGARFVLIKKTSDTGHWVVFDTARGIVAGNDARLKLNSTDAETSSYDDIDAYSAGFTLNNVPLCNANGASYIFYAIA